jgi:hypothetical protein
VNVHEYSFSFDLNRPMNFIRRQAFTMTIPLGAPATRRWKIAGITVGLLSMIGAFASPIASAAVAKQSTQLVVARLDKACALAEKYSNDIPSETYNAAREFRGILKLFTVYSTALKTINPASLAEADAVKQLRNYAAFGKAESTVILRLVSAKKTLKAGTDRALSFLTTAEALANNVRSTLRSASLPLCDEMLVGDSSSSAPTASTEPGAAAGSPIDLDSLLGSVLSQPSAANGRLEISEVYFPAFTGLKYQTTAEFEGVANQLASLTKDVYSAISIREIVDAAGLRFCIISGFQFLSTVDEATRVKAVNGATSSLGTQESAPINGFRVFIGGVPQFDKAFLARGDVLLEITFPRSSDRAAVTKFVNEFAPKLPAA